MQLNLELPRVWQNAGRARCLVLRLSLHKHQHPPYRTTLCRPVHHHLRVKRHILHSVSQYLPRSSTAVGTSPASSTTDYWHQTNYHPANFKLLSLLISNTMDTQCLQCR
jgi:hypothetical protein